MVEPNLIFHRRGDKIVRECRACCNERYRTISAARRRTAEMLAGEKEAWAACALCAEPFASTPDAGASAELCSTALSWAYCTCVVNGAASCSRGHLNRSAIVCIRGQDAVLGDAREESKIGVASRMA